MNLNLKLIFLFNSILFSSININAQDVINPYQNIIGNNLQISNWDANLQSWNIPYNPFSSVRAPAYSGEYQILLNHNSPWLQFINNNSIIMTYQMEAVSFPFTVPCATLAPSGCLNNPAMPPSQRDLFMPTTTYDPNTKKWGQLSNMLPDYLPLDYSNSNSNRQTLISIAFVENFQLTSTTHAKLLPHTIIKHTLNAYCSGVAPSSSTLLSSVSWYYDNTRGRMRYYPFCTSNCNTPAWDICFLPTIITDRLNLNPYNYNLNYQLFFDGILNYYPYNEIINQSFCTNVGTTYPNSSDNFKNNQTATNAYNFIYPPPYSLLSAPALNDLGGGLAGYTSVIGNQTITNSLTGYKQNYFIDQNIILTDINYSDKVIYNPSDVTLTTSNLHFPKDYVFKTIRGLYPTFLNYPNDEISLANNPDNGGPFSDLRDVPVITDLRCEDLSFPHDPMLRVDAKYASLYRLVNGSKLTIEPCVTVFDAAFLLGAGSTLEFENINAFRGMPRIAIDRNGGRLIKKFDNTLTNQTLLLQNKTEIANEPNSYYVDGIIEAGNHVDVNNTPGNYIADAGSGLELVSSNYIALKEGFSANANSNLVVRVEPVTIVSCAFQRSSLRKANTNGIVANNENKNECKIIMYPSVFASSVTVKMENTTSNKMKLILIDQLGREAYTTSVTSELSTLNLQNLPDGIYFVKTDLPCNPAVNKIIKISAK